MWNDSSDASAAGIYVSGDVNGTITNSSDGVIDVLVASDSREVTAYGIQIDGNVGEMGVISNAGIINAEANVDTDTDASAYGIYVESDVESDMDGAIDNSGTIDVLAASGTEDATAYGIYVDGDVGMVIPPFLTGCSRRTHAAIFSFWVGVMPPMPMFGRSLL